MNRRRHKYLPLWLALMGSLLPLQSFAQSLDRVAPEKVDKLSASLDKRLLPDGATGLEVEKSQVVAAPDLTFVPVRFQAADKNAGLQVPGLAAPRTKAYCGLYQVAGDAPAKFQLVFGAGQTETEECGGLAAIGAAAPHAEHGDLILIYNASTLHNSMHEPVILSWADSQKQYVVNDDLTEFVSSNSTKSYTVFSIRSLLASRAAKP
jgi:hypothetical protein